MLASMQVVGQLGGPRPFGSKSQGVLRVVSVVYVPVGVKGPLDVVLGSRLLGDALEIDTPRFGDQAQQCTNFAHDLAGSGQKKHAVLTVGAFGFAGETGTLRP